MEARSLPGGVQVFEKTEGITKINDVHGRTNVASAWSARATCPLLLTPYPENHHVKRTEQIQRNHEETRHDFERKTSSKKSQKKWCYDHLYPIRKEVNILNGKSSDT